MFGYVLTTPQVNARNCIDCFKASPPVEKLHFMEVRFIQSGHKCNATELIKQSPSCFPFSLLGSKYIKNGSVEQIRYNGLIVGPSPKEEGFI